MKRSWLDRQGSLAGILVLPAALLVAAVLAYPIVRAVAMSLTGLVLSDPSSGTWVGLANYLRAFRDPEFRMALTRTLYFALATVPVETVLGLLIALLLNQRFPLRNVVRGLVLLPWALPYVVNGTMWKWIYDANYGVLNALLVQTGLAKEYQIWLGQPTTAFLAVVAANVWKETPVAVILLHAALQTIPSQLYEAAMVDGATVWRRFTAITLPMLRPVIAVTLAIKTVWAIKEFDLVYIMTRGGPANATNLLTYYTYLTTFKFLRFGYGSALAILLGIVAFVVAVIYVRTLGSQEVEA
ncbi:MAG: sugar ABC transporter permease [Limnochordaceae bacterium]|nr:sugar ABC transporter permease [Limnochordaceae bacterium]